MKIVESGYKLDLHIHSCYSKSKDGAKVEFNTIENIGTLVQRLTENEVQLCAITDHDAFDLDIYRALKSYENSESTSIVKVFPGVEFSVEFEGDTSPAVVHVIAIFNDSDIAKIKKISFALNNEEGKPDYDREMAFSEEKFLSILRKIDIDTILIAHQKNSISSTKPRKSDANCVGPNRFEELVETDYFEAFEFKNKRNEVFNKAYLFHNDQEEDIRFITGSDCHDWRVYPKETESDTSEFIYSYLKCLPTFRGLVMAITDHRRIKRVNSFFNVAETYLPEIQVSISGDSFKIPLSRGINVIIGNNSIGKSLLLHKLTNYSKKQTSKIKKQLVDSYEQYLKKHSVTVESVITPEQLFGFDMQGEVREKFEEKTINSNEFLKDFYPAPIDLSRYKEIIKRELNKIYSYLEEKYKLESLINNLGSIKLEDFEGVTAESLTFSGTISRDNVKSNNLGKVSDSIDKIIEELHTISDNPTVVDSDKTVLYDIEQRLMEFKKLFIKRKEKIDLENKVIASFQTAISNFKTKYNKHISDSQKKLSAYKEDIEQYTQTIVEIIRRCEANKAPNIDFEPLDIDIQTNRVFNYEFNSRLEILRISPEYIWDLFKQAFKKDTNKSVLEMTQSDLVNALLRYDGSENEALVTLQQSVDSFVERDLKPKFTITEYGRDRTEELSAGFNAKIYFDLLSYATDKKGIYIIDQPEDNISQNAIRDYLLDRFKTMGERRQVIIVTHNPQFIVNLDVDNVIYLGNDGEGKFIIQSGALEYQDDEYSMLNIISSHIEGGLETLQRRWKRYEKNNTISAEG